MTEDLGNGWTKGADHIVGDYGSYHSARHIISIRGYLALTSDQTFYLVYTGAKPSGGSYVTELAPDEAFLLTFSSKPKLKPTGFWSVTMYDGDGFLVANSLDRYSLGDRSKLAYSDGEPLYLNGKQAGRDGSFKILLQPAYLQPSADWMTNWLTAPADGGKLSFSLRFYGADESMRDGTWAFPVVEKIRALGSG